MATMSDGIQKLKEHITCPVCLEHFTNPKILPCFHSFCLHCIEGIPKESVDGRDCVSCPVCRSSCPVPNKGLDTLPSSFVINNLMEVHDLMKKVVHVDDRDIATCNNCEKTNADRYCKQCAKFFCPQCLQLHDNWRPNDGHQTINLQEIASTAHQLLRDKPEEAINCTDHKEPLKVFCETCDELICQLCTMSKHKDHKQEVIEDSTYKKHLDTINESSLRPLNREINRLTQAKTVLNSRRNDIFQQTETVEKEIDEMIADLKASLDQAGGKLKNNVKSLFKIHFPVLQEQLKDVEKDLSMLTDCRDHVDQSLKIGTPHQVLKAKAHMMDRSASIINSIEGKNFHPRIQPDIELVKKKINLSNLAKVRFSSRFSATCDIVCPCAPLIDHASNVLLRFFFPDGSPASIPLSLFECRLTPPPNHGQPVECSVKQFSESGQYDVLFTPVTRGRHQLHVVIEDRELPGSPMGVTVTIPPKMMTKPIKIIPYEFNEPRGIAVSDNGALLVVSDGKGHCITILDNKGVKKISCKGNERGQLKHPRGVAITSAKTILVADKGNHRIQELSFEGECRSCVGSKGNGRLQFNHPHGLFIDKTTEHVFITDHGNNRVVVLDHQLTFVNSFSSESLHHPQDITVDSKGFVYVVDEKNCVRVFTIEGQFTRFLNFSSDTDLCGITVNDNNLLYINRKDGYVAVSTTNGEPKGLIDKISRSSYFCRFQSLCYCAYSGYLYVLDSEVKVY